MDCYPSHRYLHSFPTRRSSDLGSSSLDCWRSLYDFRQFLGSMLWWIDQDPLDEHDRQCLKYISSFTHIDSRSCAAGIDQPACSGSASSGCVALAHQLAHVGSTL